jgi:hypothetical protein
MISMLESPWMASFLADLQSEDREVRWNRIVSEAFYLVRRDETLSGDVDLRLMSTANDVSDIPTEGENLVIVAVLDRVLHFRIFEGDGKMVVNTNEKRLSYKDRELKLLRKRLKRLWPPHELTKNEKARVIKAVTSIVHYTRMDDSVVPYLIKELTTDYSSYLAGAQAKADKEWNWKKSLHAAWQVYCARKDLSERREAEGGVSTYLERRLAAMEEDARKYDIDVSAITCDGNNVYYAKDGYYKCPDKWNREWDDKSYRYRDIYHPNRLFAAVLAILARLGLKAVSALPALLNFVWDSDHDTVQTPWQVKREYWEESWEVQGGYTYVRVSEFLDGTLYSFGPQVIPELIQALGQGEPAATRATAILKKWDSEAVPELLRAVDDRDMVVRQRVKMLLAQRRAKSRREKPSRLKAEFSRTHARLRLLIDQDDAKTKERLRTLRSFVEHGSFRKVAAAESERSGYETDHSSPASRLRSLGESLGVPITRICEGQGVKRSELTEEGRALAEWLDLNSWVID